MTRAPQARTLPARRPCGTFRNRCNRRFTSGVAGALRTRGTFFHLFDGRKMRMVFAVTSSRFSPFASGTGPARAKSWWSPAPTVPGEMATGSRGFSPDARTPPGAIRGANHPHIHFDFFGRTDPGEQALLQKPEHLHLPLFLFFCSRNILAVVACTVIDCRSISGARERRALTVPTGTPRSLAMVARSFPS